MISGSLACARLGIWEGRVDLLRFFFFSSRRRHTRCSRDWSSDVCSSDLACHVEQSLRLVVEGGEIPVANGPIDERLDLTWERASEREVINAQPERGGAVEDRFAADRLVGIHRDWAAGLGVEEGCAALVLSANEDGVRVPGGIVARSEEHTSELQSRLHLVCRLLLEKKKKKSRKRTSR